MITNEQFNSITDLREYLLNHPDQEMIKMSCLHYLGIDFDNLKLKEDLANNIYEVEESLSDGYGWYGGKESVNKLIKLIITTLRK